MCIRDRYDCARKYACPLEEFARWLVNPFLQHANERFDLERLRHMIVHASTCLLYTSNRIISIDDSPIKICVVTTDEEVRIARETDNLVGQLNE